MLRSFCRVVIICCTCSALYLHPALSQQLANHLLPAESAVVASAPVAPVATGTKFQAPTFAGLYAPDGTFKKPPRISGRHGNGTQFNSPYAANFRPAPAFMDLHSIEDVVENYEPPGHATVRLKAHSFFGNLRDDVVTFAYGREWVLMSPTMVTTDSHHRLIIADPQQASVHVLEPKARNSFRIAGGAKLRLRAPASVAVDADDNIYVADHEKGVVLVFNPQGNYVRTIGEFGGESMFEDPQSIAIDRGLKRIYVLDAPMHELFVLDLSGRLLKRIGGPREQSGIRFINPVQMALGTDRIAILDDAGARIQVLNVNGELIDSFPVPRLSESRGVNNSAIALDSAGNIYVIDSKDALIAVLSPHGPLLGTFGQPGVENGNFGKPTGIWIDPEGSIYVADTANRRVQLFRPVADDSEPPARPISGGD
jgi:DNA-binding beta-propeller fold protein YncE